VKHYLDASVLVPSIVVEDATGAVGTFLLAKTADLIVSDFAALGVASALSRLVRMGKLASSDAAQRLADFDDWRAGPAGVAELDASDCRLASNFVRRFELKLRVPDALHAAICHRLGFQLVTLDKRLAEAARELGIDVIMIEGTERGE
jgi:uncharacterized protein